MAWFLIGATLIIVVAISAAVIAWARVVRDGIRLVERLTRPSPEVIGQGAAARRRLPHVAEQLGEERGHRLP